MNSHAILFNWGRRAYLAMLDYDEYIAISKPDTSIAERVENCLKSPNVLQASLKYTPPLPYTLHPTP